MKNEEWRPVVGYEDTYDVSSYGRVKSKDKYVNSKGGSKRLCKGKLRSISLDEDGYCRLTLYREDRKNKHCGVHRLVAYAFIPKPEHLKDIPFDDLKVDHINGIRDDNRVENLRWCTVEENNSTMLARERKSKSAYKRSDNKKSICQYTPNGDLIKIWPSGNEIENQLGYKRQSISRVCNGKQNYAYNYKWSFKQ